LSLSFLFEIFNFLVGGDICFIGKEGDSKLINFEKSHGDASTIWSVLCLGSNNNIGNNIVSSGSAGDIKTWRMNESTKKLTCTSTHFLSTQAIITMDKFSSCKELVVCGSLDKQISAIYVDPS
jgi:hypothetical protein